MRGFVLGLCLTLVATTALGQGPIVSQGPVQFENLPQKNKGVEAAPGPTTTSSNERGASMQAADHNARGVAYKHEGQLKLALAEYNQALALEPNNAEALDNRGVIWNAEGRYDRAIADYNRAIALRPSDESAYYNRGNTYANMGLTQKAIADFRHALKIEPSMRLAREALRVFGAEP